MYLRAAAFFILTLAMAPVAGAFDLFWWTQSTPHLECAPLVTAVNAHHLWKLEFLDVTNHPRLQTGENFERVQSLFHAALSRAVVLKSMGIYPDNEQTIDNALHFIKVYNEAKTSDSSAITQMRAQMFVFEKLLDASLSSHMQVYTVCVSPVPPVPTAEPMPTDAEIVSLISR